MARVIPASGGEWDSVSPQVLDNQANVHIVVVFNPPAGTEAVYINGAQVVSQSMFNNLMDPTAAVGPTYANGSILAYTLGADPLNYIGQSLYAGNPNVTPVVPPDPGLLANIDEFRIYTNALTAGQIAADHALGANQLIGTSTNVSLSVTRSGNNLNIKWPTTSALVNLVSSPQLGAGAVWTSITANLTLDGSGNYQMTVPSPSVHAVLPAATIRAIVPGPAAVCQPGMGLIPRGLAFLLGGGCKSCHYREHPWQICFCDLYGPAWHGLKAPVILLLLLLAPAGFSQAPANASFLGKCRSLANTICTIQAPMIKDGGTNYFMWGDGQGISGITSTNLRNWNDISPVFPGNPPAWTTNSVPGFAGYFWAPDIAFFNGRYNMYYACSIFGTINSAIGLVTSPSLVSPVWTDQGKVIQSNPIGQTTSNTDLTAYNCIDPSILQDTNGTVWMSFGSYSDGILIMQLDPVSGKRISANSPIYRVANNGPFFFSNTEEASFLYQHGPYYYLFVNFGGCCAGVDSTYNIRVGRSTTVTGPYFDRNGINLTNGVGTMVLESTARYIGPGQAGIMNDNGTNWFTYHYYDGNNNGDATLGMNQIYWTANGWPAVTNDWSAFYPFNTDAREHLGLYNGTLKNGATVTNEPGAGQRAESRWYLPICPTGEPGGQCQHV